MSEAPLPPVTPLPSVSWQSLPRMTHAFQALADERLRSGRLEAKLTRVRTELTGMLYVAGMLTREDGRQDWFAAMRLQIVQAQNTLHVMDVERTEVAKIEGGGQP